MYCKDCKFYKYDGIDQLWDDNYTKVLKKFVRGECNNEKFRFDYNLQKDDEFVYYDSEYYKGGFYVGELFGCVHFKEKENMQKLLSNINADLNILFNVVKHYKRIYEDKWVNKGRYNSLQAMLMRMECDQLVYDCKNLLEVIERS